MGINGGPQFSQTEAFSFQISTDTQEETDRYWNAIVSNGGEESACGWCKDRWGISWQITPRVLLDALAAGGAEAKRVFAAMMDMGKSTSPKSRPRDVADEKNRNRPSSGALPQISAHLASVTPVTVTNTSASPEKLAGL